MVVFKRHDCLFPASDNRWDLSVAESDTRRFYAGFRSGYADTALEEGDAHERNHIVRAWVAEKI